MKKNEMLELNFTAQQAVEIRQTLAVARYRAKLLSERLPNSNLWKQELEHSTEAIKTFDEKCGSNLDDVRMSLDIEAMNIAEGISPNSPKMGFI
jgi:hypothetical protein